MIVKKVLRSGGGTDLSKIVVTASIPSPSYNTLAYSTAFSAAGGGFDFVSEDRIFGMSTYSEMIPISPDIGLSTGYNHDAYLDSTFGLPIYPHVDGYNFGLIQLRPNRPGVWQGPKQTLNVAAEVGLINWQALPNATSHLPGEKALYEAINDLGLSLTPVDLGVPACYEEEIGIGDINDLVKRPLPLTTSFKTLFFIESTLDRGSLSPAFSATSLDDNNQYEIDFLVTQDSPGYIAYEMTPLKFVDYLGWQVIKGSTSTGSLTKFGDVYRLTSTFTVSGSLPITATHRGLLVRLKTVEVSSYGATAEVGIVGIHLRIV